MVIGARRVERIAALADELGEAVLAVPLDVTGEASLIAAYDAAEAKFGTVDTVIATPAWPTVDDRRRWLRALWQRWSPPSSPEFT